MTEQATQEAQEAPETPQDGTEAPGDAQEPTEDQQGQQEPDTFPRKYVERLRRESAGYRDRAKDRDDLAERLHLALVTATGRLADPTDLPFDEAHVDDEEALAAAVDELLARKPHLASRRPAGDVGQGASASGDSVDLAGILRSRAS